MLEGLFPTRWDAREPARSPVVCGALGPGLDRDVVERIASGLEPPMRPAHDGAGAIFLTDRKPRAWRHRRSRGLALPELPPPETVRPRNWQQAASELDAIGLSLAPHRTLVHSSVSGTAPIYYAAHRSAVYFSSRLDALVLGIGTPRRPDWKAWSGILTYASPFGDRTPFANVSRLPQQSCLWWGEEGLRVRSEAWPWQQAAGELPLEEGLPPLAEAIGDAVEAIGDGPLVTLLSGGADSRIVLLAALQRRDPGSLIGLTHDTGRITEAAIASSVAEAVGIKHELIRATGPDQYWEGWLRRSTLSDFQFCADVFISHLTARVGELGYPVLDGLGLDVFGARGARGYRIEMFGDDTDMTARSMWDSISKGALSRAPMLAFGRERGETMRAVSRRQMIVASRPYRGNINHPLLLWYATRTVRGVSLTPRQVFGSFAPVCTPVASHRVAMAALAIEPRQKWGSRFFNGLMGLLGTDAATLPTTAQTPKRPNQVTPHLYGDAPETLERLDDALRNPAVASLIGDEMGEVIEQGRLGEVIGNANWRRAILSMAHLSCWQRHHAAILGPFSMDGLSRPDNN
jgi:hypothetical protein